MQERKVREALCLQCVKTEYIIYWQTGWQAGQADRSAHIDDNVVIGQAIAQI